MGFIPEHLLMMMVVVVVVKMMIFLCTKDVQPWLTTYYSRAPPTHTYLVPAPPDIDR